MKRILSFVFVFFLLAALSLTALAEETDVSAAENDDGFYIEEMPEFGEADEIIFPQEEADAPTDTPADESNAEDGETSEAESLPQTDPVKENVQDAGESALTEAPPTPETAKTTSETNYLPVIIIVAVLVAGVTIILLIRKRKTTEHKHLQK